MNGMKDTKRNSTTATESGFISAVALLDAADTEATG
jgi:hypothetical protein